MKSFLLAGTLLLMTSCNPSKMLINSWQVRNIDFSDTLNTLTEGQKKIMLNKLKDNMTFSFYADSTFQVKNENDVINGKWWMNNKEKLLFTFINGQQTESKILLLKKSELQFVSSSENNQPFTFYCVPAVTNKK